jgi:hypothetical protein
MPEELQPYIDLLKSGSNAMQLDTIISSADPGFYGDNAMQDRFRSQLQAEIETFRTLLLDIIREETADAINRHQEHVHIELSQ